jgi:putative SOS response-associated peptidase YedK
MCGRFVIELSPGLVAGFFGLTEIPDLPTRYNVAPTQLVPAIREATDGSRRLSMMRWGLVPSWAKDIGDGLINARSETVSEKPSFRQTVRRRRCIIPASGFYEWQKVEKLKVPYYLRMVDSSPMPFAGIWEAWCSPDGQVLESCAILTTSANAKVAPIHDRMPVILDPAGFSLWLDRQVHEVDKLAGLFVPYPADRLEAYRVTMLVNNPAHDDAECIEPL